jgi:hypothetical protein
VFGPAARIRAPRPLSPQAAPNIPSFLDWDPFPILETTLFPQISPSTLPPDVWLQEEGLISQEMSSQLPGSISRSPFWTVQTWIPQQIARLASMGPSPEISLELFPISQPRNILKSGTDFHCCQSPADIAFCKRELQSLIQLGALQIEPQPRHLCKWFAAHNRTKRRLVVHPKLLNLFSKSPTFVQYQDLRHIQARLETGMILWSIDLKMAYYQINLPHWLRPYLSILVDGMTYSWQVVFLGLNFAPLVFTLVIRPLAALLESWGIVVKIYLDDFLGLTKNQPIRSSFPLISAASLTTAWNQAKITVKLLRQAGVVVNMVKSSPTPSLSKRHLGLYVQTNPMGFRVPEEKVCDLQAFAISLAVKANVKALSLARFIGKLISIDLAFSPPHLMLWFLVRDLYQEGIPWEDPLGRVDLSLESLNFLRSLDIASNPFKPTTSHQATTLRARLVFTDARRRPSAEERSWGLFIPSLNLCHQGHFKKDEDIQILELKAIRKALKAIFDLPMVKEDQMQSAWILFTDNSSALAYMTHPWKLSTNSRMQAIALKNFALISTEAKCLIRMKFLPGQQNLVADYLSRVLPYSTQEVYRLWHLMQENLIFSADGWLATISNFAQKI